jgi:hypothetical protein
MPPTPTEARAEDDRDRLNWGLIVSVVFSIEFWIATAGVSLPHLDSRAFPRAPPSRRCGLSESRGATLASLVIAGAAAALLNLVWLIR